MYVCICNALNERKVSAAIRESAAPSVAGVFRAHGCKPKCRRCIDLVAREVAVAKDLLIAALPTAAPACAAR